MAFSSFPGIATTVENIARYAVWSSIRRYDDDEAQSVLRVMQNVIQQIEKVFEALVNLGIKDYPLHFEPFSLSFLPSVTASLPVVYRTSSASRSFSLYLASHLHFDVTILASFLQL